MVQGRMMLVLLALWCVLILAVNIASPATFPFRSVEDVSKVAVGVEVVDLGCGKQKEVAQVIALGLPSTTGFLVLYKNPVTPVRFILVVGDAVWVGHMDGPGNTTDLFIVEQHLTTKSFKFQYRSPCGYFTSGIA
jgi:hypothetical protein